MIAHGYGRIINIGSVTSVFGYAGLAPYGASRGGVRQLTMSLADEWGKSGVTVNCLAPGWFKTEQNKVLYENQEWVDYITDRIPVKRPGQPHDLDGAVVFLASESSRYVTGQTLLVDGGISTGSARATVAPPKQSLKALQVSRARTFTLRMGFHEGSLFNSFCSPLPCVHGRLFRAGAGAGRGAT